MVEEDMSMRSEVGTASPAEQSRAAWPRLLASIHSDAYSIIAAIVIFAAALAGLLALVNPMR